MIGALEQLIFDESITLLEHSYQLNRQSTSDKVAENSLHDILQSYLLIFGQGASDNVSQVRKHQAIKAALAKQGVSSWSELVTFEHDAMWNFNFAQKTPQADSLLLLRNMLLSFQVGWKHHRDWFPLEFTPNARSCFLLKLSAFRVM